MVSHNVVEGDVFSEFSTVFLSKDITRKRDGFRIMPELPVASQPFLTRLINPGMYIIGSDSIPFQAVLTVFFMTRHFLALLKAPLVAISGNAIVAWVNLFAFMNLGSRSRNWRNDASF